MDDKIAIVTIGTELMQGLSADTNSYYLSKKLFENNFIVQTHISVCDKEEDIVRAINNLRHEHQVIITTGGLGPTTDDLTREAVSRAYGVSLEVNSELHSTACQRHKSLSAKKISSYPKGSKVIKPVVGTAGAFIYTENNDVLIALPGVPSELKEIFNKEIIPFLNNRYRKNIYRKRQEYKIYDLNEVQVEEKLMTVLDEFDSFSYGILPKIGEVCLYVTVSGKHSEKVMAKLNILDKKIKNILKNNIFIVGEETIEQSVVRQLKNKSLTVAVAESSTGGLLGSRFASVDGASEVFLGGYITYAYSIKEKLGVPHDLLLKYGAVSNPVAESMAINVQAKTSSDIAVSITGIAGPKGETKEKTKGLHYICVKAQNNNPIVKKYIFKGNREQVRRQASQKALLLIKEALR